MLRHLQYGQLLPVVLTILQLHLSVHHRLNRSCQYLYCRLC
nr:MAG TPA: hypothetical protein [Caudoviricetes sp.]